MRGPLRIGEACRYVGVSRTTLLAAEEAGRVRPHRTPGGHRRYDPEQLDEAFGLSTRRATAAAPSWGDDPDEGERRIVRADLRDVTRDGLREVVKLLDVQAAGMWLDGGGPGAQTLTFCAAFRMPRWLTDRLRDRAPPPAVAAAARTSSYRFLTVADQGLPGETIGTHGVALGTGRSRPSITGVMVLFTHADHEWLPGELRTAEACHRLLLATLEQRVRVVELERTLTRIRTVATRR